MLNILKKVQISILIFNIICTSILLMDYFHINPILLYFSYVFFNICLTIYAIIVPIILHSSIPEWQKHSLRMMKKIGGKRKRDLIVPKNTFGKQMIYDNHKQETDIYFSQFEGVLNQK
ncbi:unnamed protein product [Caenorhabditis angaria]|uniref:Uncharacterized protein n=1 Tax=Caenorhabditis angaria TaxID=860376 RepID=A0A9P1I8D1_9PELO|nr:unnamed protein product [Caenorhabditis angaria]